jgi:outer membrane lipoprotein SlyB
MNRIGCLLLLTLTSCATGPGLPVYNVGSIGIAQTTLPGVVVGARLVKIDGSSSGLNKGATIGTAVGGALGSLFAGSNHRSLGMALGGATGLVAGQAVNTRVNSSMGWEYQVQAANGQLYTIVQPEKVLFPVGARVMLTLPAGHSPGRLMPA